MSGLSGLTIREAGEAVNTVIVKCDLRVRFKRNVVPYELGGIVAWDD